MENQRVFALYRDFENEFHPADSWIVAVGKKNILSISNYATISEIDDFIKKKKNYLFVNISYELTYEILPVQKHKKINKFPLIEIWEPDNIYCFHENRIIWNKGNKNLTNEMEARKLFDTEGAQSDEHLIWKSNKSKTEYLADLNSVKKELQYGNIYELNYCQSFHSKVSVDFSLLSTFKKISPTPTPFCAYFNDSDWEYVSMSPERFIQKQGTRLRSQPIKGTRPRGLDEITDHTLSNELKNSEKEVAENVMIVDLVRNDLARIAKRNSVIVDELCGIYSFPTVHQMISTVSCDLIENINFTDILKALFPMGSMTGAPKISAVQISENLEGKSRGFYSGSFGIFYPNQDFDLSVVIRTILHNRKKNEAEIFVGGAITLLSKNEEEYQECLTKVGKLISLTGQLNETE